MSNFSAGMAAFKLSYEVSPIILNDGIAANITGQMLPIIAITEALNFPAGILDGGDNIGLDDFFANFMVVPGNTIIDQQIGHYPFANQQVAANAVIVQPLKVSLLMFCPVRQSLGYATKLAIMTALQYALQKHNITGGTYTVITPSAFYTNCVMTGLTDVSSSESKQVQNTWRWDFEQPLLTQSQATGAFNSAMNKIAGGTQTTGALSGPNAAFFPASTAITSVVPSASASVTGQTAFAPSVFSNTPSSGAA